MNPRKRVLSASALCLGLALASACAAQGTGVSQSASDAVSVSSQSQASETVITLSEDGVDIQGTGAAALVDGTVNITAGGVYRLAGALEGGVVVEEGPARDLIRNPKEERTRQFLARYQQEA